MSPRTDTFDFIKDGFIVDELSLSADLSTECSDQSYLNNLGSHFGYPPSQSYDLGYFLGGSHIQVKHKNGFTRLTLGIEAISVIGFYPERIPEMIRARKIDCCIQPEGTSQKESLSHKEALPFLESLKMPAMAMHALLMVSGVTLQDYERVTAVSRDSLIIAGLTYYEPLTRVNGNGSTSHRDKLENGFSGSVQLSEESTDWMLGDNHTTSQIVTQNQFDRLTMNCFDKESGTTHIIHEPLIGETPRSSFIYVVSGPLAHEMMQKQHGVVIPGQTGLNPSVHVDR